MKHANEKKMTILEHLDELRRRLFLIAVIIVAGSAGALIFSRQIFELLQAPLLPHLPQGSSFIALGLTEGWLVYFKVAILTGTFVTSPLWLYQIWAFLAPGLVKDERSLLTAAGFSSALCFIFGGLFCYTLIMPYGFSYLVLIMNNTGIVLMPQMKLYLSLSLRLIVAFGVVFELPIAIVFLVRLGIVELDTLKKYRRHMIVASFILSAVLTPPDVITQLFMAIPFILLYEVGLFVARFVARKNAQSESAHTDSILPFGDA